MTIQIDDGEFTRIHNDILDGLAKAHFTALEYRCLLYLVRMTYGWRKKEDVISLSQWATGIGIDSNNRGSVLNTLNGLIRQGVIYSRSNGNNRPATWGLLKAYFEKPTVMQPHNSNEDKFEQTVMPEHNSSVMQPHNRGVMPEHNTLAETVMQPHNHKRKVLKKELKKVKEKPRARSRSGVTHPNTRPILDAYVEALGYEPGNYGQESSAAKTLAKQGVEPVDVVAAYHYLKQEAFWQTKHLSLQTLVKEIPALKQAMLNGAPLTRAPTVNGRKSKGDLQNEAADEAFRMLRQRETAIHES